MPKGRFWMGKCESGETSMKDFSGMVRTPRCSVRTAQRAVPTLQQIERAQILARLIEAATAERSHKSAPVLEAFRIDFPVAPCEEIVGKRKRTRIFVVEHRHGLIGIPLMLRCKHCSSEHIEKSVHLRFHFVAELPDWMMQPRCKLDRELMCGRAQQRACDLRRRWKCISGHSAGSQFVTECCHFLVRIVPGNQCNGLLRFLGRRFPKHW